MSAETLPGFDSTIAGQNAYTHLIPIEAFDELQGLDEDIVAEVSPEKAFPDHLASTETTLSDRPAKRCQARVERKRRRGARRRRAMRASSGPCIRLF